MKDDGSTTTTTTKGRIQIGVPTNTLIDTYTQLTQMNQ